MILNFPLLAKRKFIACCDLTSAIFDETAVGMAIIPAPAIAAFLKKSLREFIFTILYLKVQSYAFLFKKQKNQNKKPVPKIFSHQKKLFF
jgi:hypothetical protein